MGSRAKSQSWTLLEDGSRDSEDCEWATNDVRALGPEWQDYQPNVAFAQGGRFDGLRAVGLASSKQARERAAHMALTAACLARLEKPQLDD